MSIPYTVVICDACGGAWTSLCLAGLFNYRLPSGEQIGVDRELGWCRQCATMRPIERLPTAESNRNDIEATATELRTQGWGSLRGAAACLFSADQRQRARQLAERRDELNRMKRLLAVRTDRRKCLNCGSMDVASLKGLENVPALDGRVRFTVPLDFVHPGCGGKLHARDSGGARIALFLRQRTYDHNGNLISDEPDEEYQAHKRYRAGRTVSPRGEESAETGRIP